MPSRSMAVVSESAMSSIIVRVWDEELELTRLLYKYLSAILN